MGANDLRDAFDRADILVDTHGVNGSHTYLPYGWALRNRYMTIIKEIMDGLGYDEWNFSDLIPESDMAIMNTKVMDIAGKVMYTSHGDDGERLVLAPTHEIPVTRMLQKRVKFESDLPIRLYHTGSAYRKAKQIQFPFNLGERRSFVEAHGVFGDSYKAIAEIPKVQATITKLITEQLVVPSITSDRPLATNNPISKQTLCTDILTRFGKTQIAGMVYFHDDIFSGPFNLRYRSIADQYKKAVTPSVLHFGFSDNLLLGAITNSFNDERFLLPTDLLPFQIGIINDIDASDMPEWVRKFPGTKVFQPKSRSHVKKIFDKLFLQGVPLIGRVRSGKLNIVVSDTSEKYEKIKKKDLVDLMNISLKVRNNYLDAKRLSTLSGNIVSINCSNMDSINRALGIGKIVMIPLYKSDQTVIEFEKKLACGEVLGFKAHDVKMKCIQTEQETNHLAYISRRF